MRRLFWFLLGVATTILVEVKGRAYYRRFLPASVQQQVESTVASAAARASDAVETFKAARAEKESELTARLRSIERGHLG